MKLKARNVLVRGVNWIGDTIISFPAIEGIRTVFPDAHLSILLRPRLATLFKNAAFVDELILHPAAGGPGSIRSELRLADKLRSRDFDLAVILPRSFRSAIIPFAAHIPCRVAYSNLQRRFLLTHPLKETAEVLTCHQVDYYYALARSLGAPDRRTLPRLPLAEEDHAWVQSFLDSSEFDQSRSLLAINPGSTYGPAKCWNPDNYFELARRLLEKFPVNIVLTGGEDNAPLIDILANRLKGCVITAVGEELLHLAALLNRCNLLITNDTGPMHIAAAVGTSVVALFGSTDVITTAPLGSGHTVIRKDLSCSPCLKRTCPGEHLCMESITVGEVEEIVAANLDSYSASSEYPLPTHRL